MHSIIISWRTLRYCLLMLAANLFFTGCTREEDPGQDLQDGQQAWVLLTVRMPQESLPASRAGSRQAQLETLISDIRVLVFENNAGQYTFAYLTEGSEIAPVGDQQQFRALIRATETPTKLVILANAAASLASYEPQPGTPEAEVRTRIELPFTTSGFSANLPMYCEYLFPAGIAAGDTHISVAALRAIARVDVLKNLAEGSTDFTLEEVHIFRANDRIRVIPDAVTDPSSPQVDAPSIPGEANFLTNPVSKIVPAGADAIQYVYIPESRAAASADQTLDGTTVLVVGGRFGGGDNPITYYRADFDPGQPAHPFGQVLRNHLYAFNIVEVSASGWTTPEDAANNFVTSIVFEVQAWEDFSSDLYFGENQFAVSSREISLRFVKNREKRLDVESTLPYTIQWLDASGNLVGGTASQPGETISNTHFDVTIVQDGGDPEEVSHLLFRTLANNHTGEVIADLLRVTVDNWSVDITVRQDNTAVYADRHFNVLSGHDYWSPVGNLGTTANPTAQSYSGQAMREILDRQFAPDGVIRIRGFAFDLLTDNTTVTVAMSTSSAAGLAEVERIFRMQDVIFSSYATEVSNAVADLLLAWLDGSPRRVLIVSTDDNSTNVNLLSRLTGDATWSHTLSNGNYVPATASGATDDFFMGPFGDVAAGSVITRPNEVLGYSTQYSANITPLIMSNYNTSAMIVGLNKSRRILYLGDANLFQSGQLSNNDGNVTSPLDRLFANTWAWIVEQLIYGND